MVQGYKQVYGYERQWMKGLDLILFILTKQKLIDYEKIQAFFFHLVGVRR